MRRRLALAALAGALLLIVGSVQVLASEVGSGFAEVRGLLAFIGAGSAGSAPALPARLVVVGIRVLSWTLAGLIVDAPAVAMAVVAGVVAAAAWRVRAGDANERTGVAFLLGTVIWGWLVLAIAVPSMATVVRELPVDHYHGFLDPAVRIGPLASPPGNLATLSGNTPAPWSHSSR
jgi:hypothetical protein